MRNRRGPAVCAGGRERSCAIAKDIITDSELGVFPPRAVTIAGEMSQDTRKDPRAKIVSLNVRYKSATVDEFIDNHAMDVSKGGIFIKTSTPFPQGTLLKFEIRLAGDQSVI